MLRSFVLFLPFRASLDLDSQSSEPAASMLLQQLIQEINQKSEELSGDDLFVTRLKLKDFANDFYVSNLNWEAWLACA